MNRKINNLVFEGGGILGISYLGVLDYLYHNGWMKDVIRIAGTSAGAITACVTSFQQSFEDIKRMASSLDYTKVPSKTGIASLDFISDEVKGMIEQIFGDINCIYRLVHHYGWFSTDYIYHWLKKTIESQFDPAKKSPPYTFADFKDETLHKNNQPFQDLYITGMNLSMKKCQVFSYETTPMMEVAKAVQISISIPLFFEAVETQDEDITDNAMEHTFCDGGVINNYPLNIFDSMKYNPNPFYGINMNTLGVRFKSNMEYNKIDNLLEYIESLMHLSSYIQEDSYESNPLNKIRSVIIDQGDISPIDFNVKENDKTYNYLYQQGYSAAKAFFENK